MQIAVTAKIAQLLEIDVGDRFGLAPRDVPPIPPPSAAFTERDPVRQGPVEVAVTGLFKPRDAEADTWTYDSQLSTPGATFDRYGNQTSQIGTALVAGGSLDRLAGDVGSLSYELYDDLDVAALRANDALAVQQALEQAKSDVSFGPTQTPARKYAAGPGTAYLITDADTALGSFRAQAAKARTLAALVLTGVVVLALLTAAMIAGLGASRRRPVLTLAGSRGASRRQLLTFTGVLVLLVTVPAGIAGQLLGSLLAGQAVGVSVLPLLALTAAALVLTSAVVGGGSGRWSRLVPGLFVMVVAVGGLAVLSLRQRALPASADVLTGSDGEAGVDWLLMATPALLALAAGLVTAALSRWPVRWAAGWSARGRGAVAHTALSRARHGGTVATVLTTGMVAAVALSGYALAVQETLQSAYQRGGWDAVGADIRVDGRLPAEPQVTDLPGVNGSAGASVVDATVLAPSGTFSSVRLVAVDTADYARVFASNPRAAGGLDGLRDRSRLVALGSPDVTSLASSGAVLRLDPTGEPMPVQVRPLSAAQAVLASAGATPAASGAGLRRGTTVLLVDRQQLQERSGIRLPTDRVFAAAGPDAVGPLAGLPGVRVTDRRAVQAGLADAPLTVGIRLAMLTALAVAAGYAAVLLIAGLALSAPARARDIARLRTLGASGRQTAALLGWELLPLTLLSTGAGLLGMLGLVVLVGPAVDLSPYTSGALVPALHLSPAAGAAVAVVAGALAVVALLVGRRLDARGTIGASLRAGET